MPKNNYPIEPVGHYEQFDRKYLIFELKTKCVTVEDLRGDWNEWERRHSEAMQKALFEVRSLFPPTEGMYRFASAIDLLERNNIWFWTVGSGRIKGKTTEFGEYKFYFSISEEEIASPELFPNYYWKPGPWRREYPMEWGLILEADVEALCVLSDLATERRLFGGRGEVQGGFDGLFGAQKLVKDFKRN